MFCEFLRALVFVCDANNAVDEDMQHEMYDDLEPAQRWFAQDIHLLRAVMMAKWLTYHKSAFHGVYGQMLLAENERDCADAVYEILTNHSPVFTDEVLIFGLCMHLNSADGNVECKKKVADLVRGSADLLHFVRVKGLVSKDSYKNPHKITLFRTTLMADKPAEYFDGRYYWTIYCSEKSGMFELERAY